MAEGRRPVTPADGSGFWERRGHHDHDGLILLGYALLMAAMLVGFVLLSGAERAQASDPALTGSATTGSSTADSIVGRRASTGEGDDSWQR